MPSIVVPSSAITLGPGYPYRAPIGSTFPANTVVGSVFTDAWPVAWIPLGVTRDGSQFSYELTTDDVVAAEYLDPLQTVPTGRSIGVAFDLMQDTNRTQMLAMNGGTLTTVSGTGATLLTQLDPPVLGAEVRTMIGWESQDGTVRRIYRQCIQSGQIQSSAQKAPNFLSYPLTLKVEQPSSGVVPFSTFFAGSTRILAA